MSTNTMQDLEKTLAGVLINVSHEYYGPDDEYGPGFLSSKFVSPANPRNSVWKTKLDNRGLKRTWEDGSYQHTWTPTQQKIVFSFITNPERNSQDFKSALAKVIEKDRRGAIARNRDVFGGHFPAMQDLLEPMAREIAQKIEKGMAERLAQAGLAGQEIHNFGWFSDSKDHHFGNLSGDEIRIYSALHHSHGGEADLVQTDLQIDLEVGYRPAPGIVEAFKGMTDELSDILASYVPQDQLVAYVKPGARP